MCADGGVLQDGRVPRTDFEIPYKELVTKELIGQGAFGRVFNGRWRGTSRLCFVSWEKKKKNRGGGAMYPL